MKTRNDIAIGLSLPLRNSNSGYFQQNFLTIDQVTSNIYNLLSTNVGERRLNILFGSKLFSLLFNPYTDVTVFKQDITNEIQSIISSNITNVKLFSINVNVEGEAVYVDIKFILSSSNVGGGGEIGTVNLLYNNSRSGV